MVASYGTTMASHAKAELLCLMNLPDYTVLAVEEDHEQYRVTVQVARSHAACPSCQAGEIAVERWSRSTQAYRDLPISGKRVTILVERQRFRCRRCERTWMEPLPGMARRHRLTERLASHAAHQGRIRPATTVAAELGLHEQTVRKLTGTRRRNGGGVRTASPLAPAAPSTAGGHMTPSEKLEAARARAQEEAQARARAHGESESEYRWRVLVRPCLRRATALDYSRWLRGYLERGGQITHAYDYPTPTDFYVAEHAFALPALYGSLAATIIVPIGVTVDVLDRGHSSLYWMDGFDFDALFGKVPAYSDTVLD